MFQLCSWIEIDKIIVRWTEGRSKGATSVVKRSTIKNGAIAVVWGKVKKAHSTEVFDDGSVTAPQQVTSNDEEPFAIELPEPALGAPSTSSSGSPPHKDRRPALIERMEHFTDTVSGMEAKIVMVARLTDVVSGMEATMLQRFRSIEDKLMQVQPPFQPAFQVIDKWHWHWPKPEDLPTPAQPSFPEIQTPLPPLESTALADVSNRSVGGGLFAMNIPFPRTIASLSASPGETWLVG